MGCRARCRRPPRFRRRSHTAPPPPPRPPPPRDDYDDEDDAPLTSEGLRGYESGGDGEPRAAPFAFGFKTAGSPGADQPQIPNLGGGGGGGGGV